VVRALDPLAPIPHIDPTLDVDVELRLARLLSPLGVCVESDRLAHAGRFAEELRGLGVEAVRARAPEDFAEVAPDDPYELFAVTSHAAASSVPPRLRWLLDESGLVAGEWPVWPELYENAPSEAEDEKSDFPAPEVRLTLPADFNPQIQQPGGTTLEIHTDDVDAARPLATALSSDTAALGWAGSRLNVKRLQHAVAEFLEPWDLDPVTHPILQASHRLLGPTRKLNVAGR